MLKSIHFESEGLELFGKLSLPENFKVGVVFLHGGGHSNSTRYEFLQNEFEKNNIASLAFDFRGCGKSDGKFENGSLAKRKVDADNAVKFFLSESGLSIKDVYIWGSSMGAHVACKLLPKYDFKGVMLQSPAAYGKGAEILKLGRKFTDFIQKSNSWEDSPAFNLLRDFDGKKLVIFGEKDGVIPEGVKMEYKNSLGDEKFFKVIHEGSHKLLSPSSDIENNTLRELSQLAIEFIA